MEKHVRDIRIRNVPEHILEKLQNIADYHNMSIANLVKLRLGDLIENTPVHIKDFVPLDKRN